MPLKRVLHRAGGLYHPPGGLSRAISIQDYSNIWMYGFVNTLQAPV